MDGQTSFDVILGGWFWNLKVELSTEFGDDVCAGWFRDRIILVSLRFDEGERSKQHTFERTNVSFGSDLPLHADGDRGKYTLACWII
jgi:hypothetical protein